MAGYLAAVFTIAGIATMIGTEVLRSIVDRRRVRETGIGGTQDIAMWGLAVMVVCILGACISGALWLADR